MCSEDFAEFLFEHLDFKPVEVSERSASVLFLDFVAESGAFELFVQFVLVDFLPD